MQKALVLDTCLLVLYVVGLTNPNYIEKHKRLYPVYNADHFRLLDRIVTQASGIVCTAHVFTETSNLLRQVGDPVRNEVMAVLRRLIGVVSEVAMESKKASDARCFQRLGLTDAAILSLNPGSVHILSVDHDLIIEAHRLGFQVTNLTPYFHEPDVRA